ncbi:MAG: histidine kinase [Cyanobacteria bacterium RYN_339]|nr:histidine kinase [Cyanobacteria bacterium RYN_339]
MRVSRSLNLGAWIAITATFLSPVLGFGWQLGRLWMHGTPVASLHPVVPYPVLGGFLVLAAAGLAACLNEVNQMGIERALKVAQSNFVAAVTHELRTPVATVRMYADMMRQGMVEDPAQREQFLGHICHECDRLSGLIDDVLTYAELGEKRRPYTFEPIAASVLVDDALAAVGGVLHAGGLAVERDVPADLVVEVDRRAMTHALINLITNAAKYGAAGGRVRLGAERHEGGVRFYVQDFGPGIPAAEHDKVFQAFYRVGDELTRKHPGSGLGLALVAEYVKAHAGKVSLESLPGAGAVFSIQLPQARTSA